MSLLKISTAPEELHPGSIKRNYFYPLRRSGAWCGAPTERGPISNYSLQRCCSYGAIHFLKV